MAKQPKKEKSQQNPDEPEVEEVDGEEEDTEVPAGSNMIVIEGEGQTVIHVDGAAQYLEQGKPIKVDDATLAALDAAGVEYKKKGK